MYIHTWSGAVSPPSPGTNEPMSTYRRIFSFYGILMVTTAHETIIKCILKPYL